MFYISYILSILHLLSKNNKLNIKYFKKNKKIIAKKGIVKSNNLKNLYYLRTQIIKKGIVMGKEIERKYLVTDNQYRIQSCVTYIQQGYLISQKERVVRVRIKGDKGYVTIKGENIGATRSEYEYAIPVVDAKEIIENLCEKPIIEKNRYIYKAEDGHVWEIDEFLGDNQGLVVAEIELSDEREEFTLPKWIGEDVTYDARYYNSNLIKNPYKNWNK